MSEDRHVGLAPAFDLSRLAYFADFALVPLAGGALIWLSSRSDDVALTSIAFALFNGIVAWSLAEYWIHRLVFHGRTPFEPMHHLHHQLPKDMIGVDSKGTFVGFAAVWLIAGAIAGRDLGAAFTAGIMAGYLFYSAIHVRFHHHRDGARLSRYVGFMNRHHEGHHRGGKGNFGVSSPIWDLVFGTFRRST